MDNHNKKIDQNSKEIGELKVRHEYLEKSINEIKNNHLKHLADGQKSIAEKVSEMAIKLEQSNQQSAPLVKLFYKFVEVLVIAVIMAGLAFGT